MHPTRNDSPLVSHTSKSSLDTTSDSGATIEKEVGQHHYNQHQLMLFNTHQPIDSQLLNTLRTYNIIKKCFKKTKRGKRGGKRTCNRKEYDAHTTNPNNHKTHKNLDISPKPTCKHGKGLNHLTIVSINVRSARNQALLISDYII